MLHVLLFGSDHLGYRIAEQLQRDGCRVTALVAEGSWLARAPLPDGVERILADGARLDVAHVPEAATADVLLAVTDQDELNLGAALGALEANPNARVVMRQFNLRLGNLVSENVPRCTSLSLSAIAAPTFALAALTPGVVFAHAFGRDTLVVREAGEGHGHATLVASADGRRLVAGSEHGVPPHPEREIRAAPAPEVVLRPPNRLLGGTLAYLAFAVVCGSAYFAARLDMSVLDAFYFVVTIITSVGFGDFNLRDADTLSKIVGIGLMSSGVIVMAVLIAQVTNSLVVRQRAYERGQVRLGLSDHVVVCGLGVIGYRVAQALLRLGIKVVVIEADEGGRFVGQARADGIPVVIGDAAQEKSLRFANAAEARAIVVCSNPDHMNLEIALHARSLFGQVPIVLRLFDPDLARRVATHFGLETAFSSAQIGAARFAAAATGSTRLARLHFDGHEVELHLVPAGAGETVGACRRRSGGDAVAVVDREGAIRLGPNDDEPLSADESLVVSIVETPRESREGAPGR
jgi:Trk K+ transport system NAD-binding subunit